jgi:hypothetical protein
MRPDGGPLPRYRRSSTALVRAGYAGQRWHDGQAEPNGGLLIVEVATSEGKIVVPVPRRDVFIALGIGASSMLPDLHRTTVAPEAVGELEKALEGFRIAGRAMPPTQLLDTLTGRVAVISAMRRKTSPEIATRLAITQARYAEFLSWMHEEAGHLTQAIWWLDRAGEWAHASRWTPMVAFTSVRKGRDCEHARRRRPPHC